MPSSIDLTCFTPQSPAHRSPIGGCTTLRTPSGTWETHRQEPDAYERASLLDRAEHLTRPLMLIHGLADDNVFVAHTLQLSARLTAAGKPHTVLPLSGVTHMASQEDVAENLLLLQVEFLQRALVS